jgi:prevent-host-death family protein
MENLIAAGEARRHFGRLLQNVHAKGETYVVERHGEPVAAVVPIEVYKQWKQQRSEILTRWRQAAQRSNLGPDEADKLAKEAVQAIRRDQAV